jgi:hypothetical protein
MQRSWPDLRFYVQVLKVTTLDSQNNWSYIWTRDFHLRLSHDSDVRLNCKPQEVPPYVGQASLTVACLRRGTKDEGVECIEKVPGVWPRTGEISSGSRKLKHSGQQLNTETRWRDRQFRASIVAELSDLYRTGVRIRYSTSVRSLLVIQPSKWYWLIESDSVGRSADSAAISWCLLVCAVGDRRRQEKQRGETKHSHYPGFDLFMII